ncbi:Protein FMC1 [Trichinella spiralis]|uniref:Protein FMC1 homolog n=1 Tax=Trichinella spiralis TaxID=6334 RepID=A0ABR3KMQ4_TRISP
MQTLRGIVFEWRKILKEPIRQTAAFQYLMKQYRKHQGAEREVCENAKQLKSLADTYLIYLQSTRMLKQLEDKYYHKTGITTEEAAAKSMACQRRLLDLSSLIICKSEQNGISESVDRIFP